MKTDIDIQNIEDFFMNNEGEIRIKVSEVGETYDAHLFDKNGEPLIELLSVGSFSKTKSVERCLSELNDALSSYPKEPEQAPVQHTVSKAARAFLNHMRGTFGYDEEDVNHLLSTVAVTKEAHETINLSDIEDMWGLAFGVMSQVPFQRVRKSQRRDRQKQKRVPA